MLKNEELNSKDKRDHDEVSIVSNAIKDYSLRSDKTSEDADYPDNMMIEVTNACNLSCDMCYHKHMKRKIGFIEIALFTKIVTEAKELGVKKLGLYTTGEAFLHPRIFDLIKIAKDIGIGYVYITTNGQLLKNKVDQLLDSGLDSIKFSIDAVSKESYESLKPGGTWNNLINVITELRDKRDKSHSKLKIFASFLITNSNYKQIGLYSNVYGKLFDETIYSFVENLGGQSDKDFNELFPGEISAELTKLILPRNKWHPCELLWNRFIVTYDGLLTICCVDFESRLTYADLKESSLKESWNNKKMKSIRNLMVRGEFEKIPLCNVCDQIKQDTAVRNGLIKKLSQRFNLGEG